MEGVYAVMGEEEASIVCVGDIHGYFDKLQKLWRNLELRMGTASFLKATIIFLGDYCDRGPDTSQVLDFLVSLPSRYPSQNHVFLCGNHDFAFAAFLHALPPPPSGFSFRQTWEAFRGNEQREGWWNGPGHQSMHIQGLRWAGNIQDTFNLKKGTAYQGSIYDAAPTFSSYGCSHGHQGLVDAVPSNHKKFLQDLVWVYEQEISWTKYGADYRKLIAVHAGLEKSKPVEQQLEVLRERDVTLPRIEALSGRKNVWDTPLELVEQNVLVVSGHHATMHIDKLRLIIDEGGGLNALPIAAIILPSRVVVRNTDDPDWYIKTGSMWTNHCTVML